MISLPAGTRSTVTALDTLDDNRTTGVAPLSVSIETPLHGTPTIVDVLLLDEVLDRMAAFDPRAARITEMRMFLGLSEEEIAESGDGERTAQRSVRSQTLRY